VKRDDDTAIPGLAGFDAYRAAIELIECLRVLVKKIRMHDRDLTNQITRAASSIALNLAEGRRREKGDRLQLFATAHGSAGEVKAALEIARSWEWVSEDESKPALELLDRVLAMCWRLTHPKP
jgi:four helix bundle protein